MSGSHKKKTVCDRVVLLPLYLCLDELDGPERKQHGVDMWNLELHMHTERALFSFYPV